MTDDILSLSWSRLRTWMECHQKAHLQSKGVRSPAQNLKVFHKGTVVDRILRDWLLEPNPELGTMHSKVEEYMVKLEEEYAERQSGVVRWDHAEEKLNTAKWCKRLLDKLEPVVEELILPYQYTPDLRFKVPLMIPGLDGTPTEISLTGAIDIHVVEGPELVSVYDLKATENNSYWKKTIMQLVFYALAMYSRDGFYPHRVALLQPMCADPVLNLKFTEEDHVLSLVAKITEYAHSVWRKEFDPKVSDVGCDWCPVKFACPKFARDKNSKRVPFQ